MLFCWSVQPGGTLDLKSPFGLKGIYHYINPLKAKSLAKDLFAQPSLVLCEIFCGAMNSEWDRLNDF